MADKPNFVLVPEAEPVSGSDRPAPVAGPAPAAGPAPVALLGRLRALAASASALLPVRPALSSESAAGSTKPAAGAVAAWTGRPRLVFGFDATASREPAWATARQVTDALVRALPGALDVALAVHGGGRLHTFTPFTANPTTLRDRAAGIACIAGPTRLLPILSRALVEPGVRVVTYIGDVFEESPARGRALADEMGRRGTRLIVLHDVADWNARRDADFFHDLAHRTGGCVLPFDTNAPDRLRDLLAAVAVYAVGGEALLEAKRAELPGALVLLRHLSGG